MTDTSWMLYGAYGYTGVLLAEEAVKRGHKPLLAGRNAEKLARLAERLGLQYVAFDVDDEAKIAKHLARVKLVLHSAGPFTQTAAPMRKACLIAGVHYLDITGEIKVFEQTFQQDVLAKQRGILMMSGAGFDVIPTDCLAKYVADQVPGAVELEIGILMGSGGNMSASAGTMKSALEIIAGGGLVRRGGQLQSYTLGKGAKRIRFSQKVRQALPFPWGDLATAYRTTGIPNIITYMVFPLRTIRTLQTFGVTARPLMMVKPLRRLTQKIIDWQRKDRPAHMGGESRTSLWARAVDSNGKAVEAWMDTLDGYHFTAVAGVRVVEHVLANPVVGALSPAQVLGADFVLGIEGTTRFDTLPDAEKGAFVQRN